MPSHTVSERVLRKKKKKIGVRSKMSDHGRRASMITRAFTKK